MDCSGKRERSSILGFGFKTLGHCLSDGIAVAFCWRSTGRSWTAEVVSSLQAIKAIIYELQKIHGVIERNHVKIKFKCDEVFQELYK